MKRATAIRDLSFRFMVACDRFRAEMRGVAAVEFAFIAPIMLLLFVGTIELSAGISVNRKLSRLSSTISDLVTQSKSLTEDEVYAIMDVSSQVMYPYIMTDADKPKVKIIVTGIEIDTGGTAKVAWSFSQPDGNAFTVGTPYAVPTKIRKPKSFLVAARISTDYTPSFGWAKYSTANGVSFDRTAIPMEEEIFLRPRIGSSVTIN